MGPPQDIARIFIEFFLASETLGRISLTLRRKKKRFGLPIQKNKNKNKKVIIIKRGAAARASCHPPPLPRILLERIMRNYKGYIHYVLLMIRDCSQTSLNELHTEVLSNQKCALA